MWAWLAFLAIGICAIAAVLAWALQRASAHLTDACEGEHVYRGRPRW